MIGSGTDHAEALGLRHLRVFEMVSRLGSIRKASDAVHLSQPAVTQAMIKLERQIGVSLLARRSSGTYATPAGEALAARVAMMFREIEEALGAFGVSPAKNRSIAHVAERITRSQVRGLAAIARGTSFADASRSVGLSQPSLHRAARELERSIGKPLFHQTAQGVTATRAGAELSRRLSLALREIEWGLQEALTLAGLGGGQIKVGAMPLAGSFLLADVLNEITRRYEGVHVQVTTGSSTHLTRGLQLGEFDFLVGVVLPHLDPDEFNYESMFASNYLVVARRDHPLASKPDITSADLAQHDWIVPVAGAARREAFDYLFRSMPSQPNANIETYALPTIRLLLSGSNRLTLMTRFEFEYERDVGALVGLPFPMPEPIHFIGVTTRARWKPTAMHLEFLNLIREYAQRVSRPLPEGSILPSRSGAVGNNLPLLDSGAEIVPALRKVQKGNLVTKASPQRLKVV